MNRSHLALLTAATCGMVSCASLKSAGENSMAVVHTSVGAVKNSASVAMTKMSDLPLVYLLPGQGPRVVEARESDLKELPTGHELAQAHERQGGFWIFGGPVDFKEPMLPATGAEMDGSLLPPRMP